MARRLASITEASQAGAAPAPVGRLAPSTMQTPRKTRSDSPLPFARSIHIRSPYGRMVVFPFVLNEETTLTLLCGVVFVHRKL
jgi:hypothetical protein